MKHKIVRILLLAVVLAGGAAFRLWRLNDRPMHTDEAVHAEKFGVLLEKGRYRYDPEEFHGPTLNYFTRISAGLRGELSYQDISETTLRITPAVFGMALILTPLLFVRGIGFRAAFFSCVFLAFSPLFVYYSRYYIQEALLVFFTAVFLGAVWNYYYQRRIYWILLAGAALGLMHATKETFVFAVAAAAIALVFCAVINGGSGKIKAVHLLAGLLTAVAVSVLFYSSFGANWQGVVDSVTTYAVWAGRAGGHSVHSHPWYYYLDLLTWLEFIEPLSWNEDVIAALAMIGAGLAFFQKGGLRYRTARFFAVYMLVLTAIYCVIPYKTPWSMTSFVYGMVIAAGFAADRLLHSAQRCWTKCIFWTLLGIYGLASPLAQAWLLNFRYAADPVNPYVYAHTAGDVYSMLDRVKSAAANLPEGQAVTIGVIAAGDDYWPLPWYLRGFPTGYWRRPDPLVCVMPIILASAQHEEELLTLLYTVPPPGQRHLYLPLFERPLYLRPGVEWRGYIRKDLWDLMHKSPVPTQIPPQPRETLIQSQPDKTRIPNLLKFSHRAMNANFEIFIQHDNGTYAGRAARAAFNEVDRLEAQLSRFVENSDISRINRLSAGQSAVADEDTLNCLTTARQAWELTEGAFDVTIGGIIEAWKAQDSKRAIELLSHRPNMGMLKIDRRMHSVTMLGEGVCLDLGGIGKGYAVDAIGRVLKEWGADRALIHAGTSSVLALDAPQGQPGWKVSLTNPADETIAARLSLANGVLSCSGLSGGSHIINPFTGQPVSDRRACWVRSAPNAALADALSTAGMILPAEKLHALCKTVPGISIMVVLIKPDGQTILLQWGDWPMAYEMSV
ncbi:MAG: TIGR03663 family protein [Planctomycetales bacterium]|nr:TIGR03663 family protein [Planctomycetales bacterium]